MDYVIAVFLLGYVIIGFIVGLKVLFYFEYNDDDEGNLSAIGPQIVAKFAILLGFLLLWVSVVLLPLDAYTHHDEHVNQQPIQNFTSIKLEQVPEYSYIPPPNLGIEMDLFWFVICWMIAIYLVFVLPFAMFYYEADDDIRVTKSTPLKQAFCRTAVSLLITALIISVIYVFVMFANVAVDASICSHLPAANYRFSYSEVQKACREVVSGNKNAAFRIRTGVSFSIYLVTIMSFVGWFFFVLFGGIGLAAFPMDLIIGFIDRPKPISPEQYARMASLLGEKAKSLAAIGRRLVRHAAEKQAMQKRRNWWLCLWKKSNHRLLRQSNRQQELSKESELDMNQGPRERYGVPEGKFRIMGRHNKRGLKKVFLEQEGRRLGNLTVNCGNGIDGEVRRFGLAVAVLESEARWLATAGHRRGENPAVSFAKLGAGILSLLLSLLWTLHLLLYMVLPTLFHLSSHTLARLGFVDSVLRVLVDSNMGLLSLLIYCILIVYLLICVMKGCFKFGMRIFCCIKIHPMKCKETHLNSILFNLSILLVSSSAIIQFSQQAFVAFCNMTVATWIFQVQIQFVKFFGLFFKHNIFVYSLLGWILMSSLYFVVRPREKMPYKLKCSPLPDDMGIQASEELQRSQIECEGQRADAWEKDMSEWGKEEMLSETEQLERSLSESGLTHDFIGNWKLKNEQNKKVQKPLKTITWNKTGLNKTDIEIESMDPQKNLTHKSNQVRKSWLGGINKVRRKLNSKTSRKHSMPSNVTEVPPCPRFSLHHSLPLPDEHFNVAPSLPPSSGKWGRKKQSVL